MICGSATAAVLSLRASASKPLSGQVPGQPLRGPGPAALFSQAGAGYQITVSPGLAAGGAGWTSSLTFSRNGKLAFGERSGGPYPTAASPIFGGTGIGYVQIAPHRTFSLAFSLTGPQVAAIRYDGRTVRTFTSPQLPTGDRAAVFFLPPGAPAPVVAGGAQRISGGTVLVPAGPPESTRRIPAAELVPLDTTGQIIPTTAQIAAITPSTSFWQAATADTPTSQSPPYDGPTHPARGACELDQSGLPGLTPEWGHTLGRIAPVTEAQGELLLSCIDTHYYLNGWPITAAVF